jgi:hypothetical protein
MMPRREEDLEARDSFGALLLGTISALARLDALLPSASDLPAGTPILDAHDRLLLDALLGAVALRNSLATHLGDVPLSDPAPRADEDWRAIASLRR